MGMKPRRTRDQLLGQLSYEEGIGAYVAKASYENHVVQIQLDCYDEAHLGDAAIRGRVVLRDLGSLARAAADYAVVKLLDLHNDNWRDEDAPRVSADEFKSRMTLVAISVGEDGSLTFYHRDGDLFWGHCIEIGRNAKGDFYHAAIPG